MFNKKMFFGWDNIKWFLREVLNIYSNKESFFSKKRIESGLAFIILQWGMIYWLKLNVETISSSDLFIWSSIECVICGYTLNKIQSEKTEDKTLKKNLIDLNKVEKNENLDEPPIQ